MTRDADYWAGRRKELLAQMEADEERLNKRLAKVYDRQARQLEREIAAYYQQYGEQNVIRYRDLLHDLSDTDRKLLMERMDDFAEKYPQYADLMPVRESIYKLNRLEGIQTAIRLQQLEIGAIEQEELDEHFKKLAQRSANLAAEEMGFGKEFYSIDSQLVSATVGRRWSKGESYSEKIWNNREKLAAYLNDDFAQMVARGDSYEKAVKALKERFEGVSERDIRRLVFTEGTFLTNEAQAQVHQSEYEYYALACADARACDVCKALEREQLAHPARFDEREPGVNFPPMHPWCRCGYTIEVPDYEEWEAEYASRHGSTPPESAKVERGRSMPEIAGINPGAPMSHDDADSGRVNPHFLEGREWQTNCQSCVVTYEARRRGYDVEVRSRYGGMDELARDARIAWKNPETGERPEFMQDTSVKTAKQCYKWLEKVIEKGNRYEIRFNWKGRSRIGHIVCISKDSSGTLVMYDPQCDRSYRGEDIVTKVYTAEEIERRKLIYGERSVRGRKTTETRNALLEYLERLKYTETWHGRKYSCAPKALRVDNMEIDIDTANKIMRGVER